jgi:hypothetical protein
LVQRIRALPGVSDVFVPQDVDYPGLQVNVNRARASELGLDPKEVIDNMITALTSDVMIAPSYWVGPRSGKQLLRYRPISGKSGNQLRVSESHAPACAKFEIPNVSESGCQCDADPDSYRGRPLSVGERL